jgi:tRNA(Ile)-lysidine synthase
MMVAMRPSPTPSLAIETSYLKPGMRLAVGLSGGADSVALLRVLQERSRELGLVVSAAHLHHGLRGAEADADQEFCRELARELGLPFFTDRVDVVAASERGESIEEAGRRLRYGWFRQLLARGEVEAFATAHTRDDQAETVLLKLLRGAWTEGLSGIHPLVELAEGRVVRPLLGVTRSAIEAYLTGLGQSWREDSSNRDLAFARNRVRHELLPHLESWNPRLREHLAQMAVLARDEEAWWAAQLAWLAPQLVLPGSPVRGGGRAAGPGVALEARNLAVQPAAMQRRVLRYAAGQLGCRLDFAATEKLRSLAIAGRAGQRCELAQGLRAERTHRELRLRMAAAPSPAAAENQGASEVSGAIPAELEGFGLRLSIQASAPEFAGQTARLRNWRPGDRVHPRYSSGPRKVKDVLERLRVTGSGREQWPVLEVAGRIVWMKDVELEPWAGVAVVATDAAEAV